MLESVTDQISALLYPRVCLNCGNSQPHSHFGSACAECWSATQIFDGTQANCEKCGSMLGATSFGIETKCWQCDEFHFDNARSCGPYSGALKAEIVSLKTTPEISPHLLEMLVRAIEIFELKTASLIVPVPLTKRRLFERGFNQAEIIAKVISRVFAIPADSLSLQCTVHSPIHRIGMDRKARDLSVKNAFRVVRPNLIRDHKILLVDDVYTTGATVNYCAKALKKDGADEVNVITIARATMNF